MKSAIEQIKESTDTDKYKNLSREELGELLFDPFLQALRANGAVNRYIEKTDISEILERKNQYERNRIYYEIRELLDKIEMSDKVYFDTCKRLEEIIGDVDDAHTTDDDFLDEVTDSDNDFIY